MYVLVSISQGSHLLEMFQRDAPIVELPFGISPSVDSGTGVDVPTRETVVESVDRLALKGSMEIEDREGSGDRLRDTNLRRFRFPAGEVITIVLHF